MSIKRKQGMTTIFLMSKPGGSRYSARTIQAQHSKACVDAKVTGATFHDLKSKAISDFEGTLAEKQNASGHVTLAQTTSYVRKIQSVKTTR
jgi:hypothetical protein